MDIQTVWHQFTSAIGLNEERASDTVRTAIQVVVVLILTIWIADVVTNRIRRAAKAEHVYADVAILVSRAAGLAIFGVGAAIILGTLGVNPTAIAAVLGAATVGISLAFQDVGRNFVNGVYILIERPFRTGDRIRIGGTEGRVEEVGVRLTRLRTDAGVRVLVPNSVVFSSVIDNTSAGRIDRQRYGISGVKAPTSEIQPAIVQALRGTPHLSARKPIVNFLEISPEGTTIAVTVEHDLGHQVDDVVIDRLHAVFPEATVTAQSAIGTS